MNPVHRSHAPSPRQAGFQWLPLTLLLAAAGGLALYGKNANWFGQETGEALAGAPVRRGPLRISVVERGSLKAADSVSIKSELEGQATILYLIAEGTKVKEGDLLVELDATSLIDRRFQQDITTRNAEAALVKARQTYEIQQSQNLSDIAAAEQKLEFAGQDLLKFREGDRKVKLEKARESIILATEEAARASDKFVWSQKLYDQGSITATELEADKLANRRAEILLEQAKRELSLLEEYTLPREEAELVAGLAEGERELERVKLQATARIVDFEADMRTSEAKFNLESEKLAKLEAQITKATIRAPRAGMVVYAKQEGGGRMGGSGEPIQEGTSVRERQEIITIPNAIGMIAQMSVHESVLKQVQRNQSCLVKIDALRLEYPGRVISVAVLPDQNSWWANPNTRLYRTDVAIESGNEEMRPGMSCSIEVLVEDIPDTLYVPVQSVLRHEGKSIAFVHGPGNPVLREVTTGRFNDQWVQVLEGLAEGEIVLLSPPPGFTPQPGEDQAGKEVPPLAPFPAVPAGMPGAADAIDPAAAPARPEGMPQGAPGGGRRGRGGEGGPERMGGRRGEGSGPAGGDAGTSVRRGGGQAPTGATEAAGEPATGSGGTQGDGSKQ